MNVYCPYTQLERITQRALAGTHAKYLELPDDEAYWRHFRDRWEEGATFINVEHDVVPWPGALEELWDCKNRWCAYGYMPYDDLTSDSYSVFLGCVKFGAEFIKHMPNVWTTAPSKHWSQLDGPLTVHARNLGFNVCQHYPAVLNIGQGFKVHNPETL